MKTELHFRVVKDGRGKYSILTERGGVSGLDEKAVEEQVQKLKKAGKKVAGWPMRKSG